MVAIGALNNLKALKLRVTYRTQLQRTHVQFPSRKYSNVLRISPDEQVLGAERIRELGSPQGDAEGARRLRLKNRFNAAPIKAAPVSVNAGAPRIDADFLRVLHRGKLFLRPQRMLPSRPVVGEGLPNRPS